MSLNYEKNQIEIIKMLEKKNNYSKMIFYSYDRRLIIKPLKIRIPSNYKLFLQAYL